MTLKVHISVGPHLISVITVLWALQHFQGAKNHVFAYKKLIVLQLKKIFPTKADKIPFQGDCVKKFIAGFLDQKEREKLKK